MQETHYRSCNLCEAMCGLTIEVEDSRVTSIKGDKEDPFSRGHICPKGTELKNLYEDPDRIKRPLKRTESGWEEISWPQALSEVARGLHEVQSKHGNDAVGVYLGNPTVHNYGSMLMGQKFVNRLKTRNLFSATSVDQLPHQLLAYWMFGHQLMIPIPDIDRTQYMLILGGNPIASNGSLMTVPDVRKRLNDIQKRGGKYVVIDPRKTETAALADEHHFIRPGTDAYFLLGLVRILFEEKRTQGPVHYSSEELQKLENLAKSYELDAIATITGISVESMRKIALEFADSESAVCYGRVGVSMQEFGAVCQWLINVINAITGNMDRPGGAMFTLPAVDVVDPKSVMRTSPGSFNDYQTRVRGLPEFSGELPVSALAEEILTEGPGQIRAMVTNAGNPVLSTPNGAQLDQALEGLEFMVSVDLYLNETTRHAHYILPPTSALEHDHYDLVFNVFAVRNTTRFNEPVFAPEDGMLHDWQIYADLAKRMDFVRAGKPLPEKVIESRLTPASMIDYALQAGPYGTRSGKGPLSLEHLKQNPHGVDLGPLQPCFPHRLCTEDHLLRLVPAEILGDEDRLRSRFEQWKNDQKNGKELLLIGRRHLRSNNSWMHNMAKLMTGKERCTLMVHPDDATRFGLSDARQAVVESRVGKITVPVEITADIMTGVVSIPHGFGHTRKNVRWQVASEHPGVSINDLTDDQAIDALSGNAAFSGVPVSVRPAD